MSWPLSNGMIRHFNNDHMELRRENYQNEDESKLKYEHSFNKMNEWAVKGDAVDCRLGWCCRVSRWRPVLKTRVVADCDHVLKLFTRTFYETLPELLQLLRTSRTTSSEVNLSAYRGVQTYLYIILWLGLAWLSGLLTLSDCNDTTSAAIISELRPYCCCCCFCWRLRNVAERVCSHFL